MYTRIWRAKAALRKYQAALSVIEAHSCGFFLGDDVVTESGRIEGRRRAVALQHKLSCLKGDWQIAAAASIVGEIAEMLRFNVKLNQMYPLLHQLHYRGEKIWMKKRDLEGALLGLKWEARERRKLVWTTVSEVTLKIPRDILAVAHRPLRSRRSASRTSTQSALQVLEVWAAVLPARIAKEDLGDYVENIHHGTQRGEPGWLIYVRCGAAIFWTGLNALSYALKAIGRQKS